MPSSAAGAIPGCTARESPARPLRWAGGAGGGESLLEAPAGAADPLASLLPGGAGDPLLAFTGASGGEDAVGLVLTDSVRQTLTLVAPWLRDGFPFVLVRGVSYEGGRAGQGAGPPH